MWRQWVHWSVTVKATKQQRSQCLHHLPKAGKGEDYMGRYLQKRAPTM
uniref:MGC131286 protein n=1 Tax=Xenopus laevis TaxID=8355 RepID=Q3KPV6_XENLA|nr:MGC131286 protein [Xenopus laevis]